MGSMGRLIDDRLREHGSMENYLKWLEEQIKKQPESIKLIHTDTVKSPVVK